MSEPLTELMVRRAVAAFETIPPEEAADTYVVSFFVNDDYDDPRVPVLTVGTNTETQVRASVMRTPDRRGSPPRVPESWADPEEARWNFAFWQQNHLAVVGGPDDPAGKSVVDAVFATLGLQWNGEDFSPEADDVCVQMTEAFVACCLEAARRLHEHEALLATFGRDIPVLVHELEFYDLMAEQNARCNPSHLVAPFKLWIDSL